MSLTSLEIYGIVRDWIADSLLGQAVKDIYPNHYPETPTNRSIKGEFLVVSPLTNAIGEGQVATVNVNIYVPDLTPRINAIAQRYPNNERLAELTRLAFDSLRGYPTPERWYFDVSSEVILTEKEIPYSFANIKVTFKKY